MIKGIFDFREYKAYLRHRLRYMPKGGRGFKSVLAQHLGCQTSYVSQVLNKGADFSPEQAEMANEVLNHTALESRYFILLVEFARAGTEGLRRHYKKIIDEENHKQFLLSERIKVKEVLSEEDKSLYYSNCIFTCIHMLVSIPEYQTIEAIGRYLGLPKKVVLDILDKLVGFGCIVSVNGRYIMGPSRIHISSGSPMLLRHHTNWRVEALRRLQYHREDATRFTAISSVSKEDYNKIRKILISTVETYNKSIEESSAEELVCLNIDFFRMGEED